MGKRGNQNFVAIPTGRLIERLKQLCPEYGIILTITEEANTSAASYLDGDTLPKHGEKLAAGCGNSLPAQEAATQRAEGWKASGKRVQSLRLAPGCSIRERSAARLYKSSQGWLINADCNAAANIMRKGATQLGLDLVKVGRGALALPQRVDLFKGLSKLYRKRCEVGLLAHGAASA